MRPVLEMSRTAAARAITAAALLATPIGAAGEEHRDPTVDDDRYRRVVIASWYGPRFDGRLTASGDIFEQDALTAAHRSLPFGTELEVTNIRNGRTVVVVVNDRGPYVGKRGLDLSREAARQLDMIDVGIGPVLIEQR